MVQEVSFSVSNLQLNRPSIDTNLKEGEPSLLDPLPGGWLENFLDFGLVITGELYENERNTDRV